MSRSLDFSVVPLLLPLSPRQRRIVLLLGGQFSLIPLLRRTGHNVSFKKQIHTIGIGSSVLRSRWFP